MFSSCYGSSVLMDTACDYSTSCLDDQEQKAVCEFLVLLAVCNTVVVSEHSHNAVVSPTPHVTVICSFGFFELKQMVD